MAQFGENTRWVIMEVAVLDGQATLFVSPETLKLKPGFDGEIIWYVFTPGWQLDSNEGIVFAESSGFQGHPQPDPTRPGCWMTVAANTGPASFRYTVTVRNPATGALASFDPVVESEAPPTAPLLVAVPQQRAASNRSR